jgi:hypothetical protein
MTCNMPAGDRAMPDDPDKIYSNTLVTISLKGELRVSKTRANRWEPEAGCPNMPLLRRVGASAMWSLSGEERTWFGHRVSVDQYWTFPRCVCRKVDSAILMVKAAKDRS